MVTLSHQRFNNRILLTSVHNFFKNYRKNFQLVFLLRPMSENVMCREKQIIILIEHEFHKLVKDFSTTAFSLSNMYTATVHLKFSIN